MMGDQVQDVVRAAEGQTVAALSARIATATKTIQNAQLTSQIGWVQSIRGAIVKATLTETVHYLAPLEAPKDCRKKR